MTWHSQATLDQEPLRALLPSILALRPLPKHQLQWVCEVRVVAASAVDRGCSWCCSLGPVLWPMSRNCRQAKGQGGSFFPAVWLLAGAVVVCAPLQVVLVFGLVLVPPPPLFFAVAFGHPFVLIFLFLLHDGVCGLMRGHMIWTLEFGRENGLMSSSDAEKYK